MTSNIIQLLPDAIANQIAAGEVVQRPASVVKELLENAIDAGASSVQLIVKDGGKTLIQVIDNGKGMSESDARLCFERHATSKLRTTEDLFNIRTLGFRGEAMASIAAVAQVELRTKRPEDEVGQLIKIEGSDILTHEETACQDGTSIKVKNLFFNVPARRNFLKSNPVELKHIVEEFQRVALANPDITFSMMQNDLETFRLPAAKLSQRIVNIFGKSYQQQLAVVDEDTPLVKIKGYVGRPESAKRTRGEQYFFANKRFIKHPYLHHAVTDAFQGMLAEKTYPFYVLFMEIEPRHIDINVHPTKTEIKFDDERSVYGIMKSAVKKALGVHNIAPSIDFEQDINFGISTIGKRDYGNEKPPFEVPPINNIPQKNTTPREKHNQDNWQNLYQGFDSGSQPLSQPPFEQSDFELTSPQSGDEPQTIRVASAMNNREGEVPMLEKQTDNTFQIQQRYIIAHVKSGIMMIDQQAAHERVLYEKYLKAQENKRTASQQFLFPQQLELSVTDYALVQELTEEIKSLGFSFEDFGRNTIVLNGIPADVPAGSEQALFEGFIEQFKLNKSELKLENSENLARALAKRSAIKKGKSLNREEMNGLIDELFACRQPNNAPNGNLTFVILGSDTIENYFTQR